MNKSTFDNLLTHIQSAERQVRDDGQREYAQDNDNVFANFDRVAKHLNLTREQVLLVYALKHWDGIVSYVKGHKSQREDIRGRIKDLRLYLALLWGMVDEDTATNGTESGRGPTPESHPELFGYRLKSGDMRVRGEGAPPPYL